MQKMLIIQTRTSGTDVDRETDDYDVKPKDEDDDNDGYSVDEAENDDSYMTTMI